MGSGSSIVTPDQGFDYDILESSLLKSGESLSELLKYLEDKKKDCILYWYLDILEYSATESKNLLLKAMEIRTRYDHLINKLGGDKNLLIEIWKSVDKTLPNKGDSILWRNDSCELNGKMITRLAEAKRFSLSLLANEINGFCRAQYWCSWDDALSAGKFSSESIKRKNSNKMTTESQKKYDRVLIIEDSSINAQKIAESLAAKGHTTCQAYHGRIGVHLAIVSENKFDSILIDMSMTTMDPIEVVQQIKAFYNGKVHISQPLKVFQSKSLRAGKSNRRNTPMFYSSRVIKHEEKVSYSLNQNNNDIKADGSIFISLVKNNPTYRFNRSYFHGSINLLTYVDCDTIADVSILALSFEYYNILKEVENISKVIDRIPSSVSTSTDNCDNEYMSCIPIRMFPNFGFYCYSK